MTEKPIASTQKVSTFREKLCTIYGNVCMNEGQRDLL